MKFAIIITLCLYLLINSAIIRETSIQYYSFKTQKHITHLSMYKERHSYIITNSTPKNTIAEVTYINDIETFGWGKLNVHTYNKSDEYTQSYCAGYLEGIVTYQEISNFYYNLYHNYLKESKLIDKIIAFLELVGKELMLNLSHIKRDTSFYEYQLYLSFQQLVGLYHGYNSMSKTNKLFVFYTRRTVDYKYSMGCAFFDGKNEWKRCDEWLDTIKHGSDGEFDSEMVYFPAVIDTGKKIFLFYCGNGYGVEGFGYKVAPYTDTYIVKNQKIAKKTLQSYTVTFNLEGINAPQNYDQGKKFSATFKIEV